MAEATSVQPTPDGGAEVTFQDPAAEQQDAPNQEIRFLIETTNIAEEVKKIKKRRFPSYFDEEELLDGEEILEQIGKIVKDEYKADRLSRSDWEEKVKDAIKTFTAYLDGETTNKSRVMLPMVAIAILQFHARAYDALLPSKEIVSALPTGSKNQETLDRAERVAKYTNYDLLYNMEDFIEGMDASLMQLPLEGSVFRKTFYDPVTNKNISQNCSAMDCVMNYRANPSNPERLTHVYDLTTDAIRVRVSKGMFLEEAWDLKQGDESKGADSEIKQQQDKSDGQQETSQVEKKPRVILEQHRMWDLNGDGLEEPYVVTVDFETAKVLRITSRRAINALGEEITVNYFTHYKFLHNPEGSYGLGFWTFMGHLNEAANALINEAIDATHLANVQGGFINRRSNIKKGQLRFKRGEFQNVDITGDDIRKSIFSFDFKGPPDALFRLLGLLFEQSKLVSSVSDAMEGKFPSSDTPAAAIINASEEGRKVFNSIYRRLHRTFSKEVKKLYILNGVFLDEEKAFTALGQSSRPDAPGGQTVVGRKDFDNAIDLFLVSDPNITSRGENITKAEVVYKNTLSVPATANDPEVVREAMARFYKAMDVDNFEVLLPKPPQPPPDLPQEEENALFLQDRGSVVLRQQDHVNHLEVMNAFEQTLFFGELPPQGKKLFEQHRKEHMAELYLTQQQPTQDAITGATQNVAGNGGG